MPQEAQAPARISDEQFTLVQMQVGALANLVQGLDLAGFVAACNHADTIGPILDPTLWMRGHRDMEVMRELVSLLIPFQRKAAEVMAAAGVEPRKRA